ncbi:unnamed protein product [Arctia plantaginis]|uniref:Uncharacterized protein n=1 Tax=Arctia plantaginis TaxID=874455 RepID=A0A8S1B0Q1_ARCPL|nr:unnamed protein product [Arctia plantaginis]
MCVKPNNIEAHVYSSRVDTAIMKLVGLTCGWMSSFRPFTNVVQQAPPFGWGLRVHSRNFQAGEYSVVTLSASAMGNLEVAYLTQAKGWHAPLRGLNLCCGSDEKKPDFQGEAPTSPPDAPIAPGGVVNVGAAYHEVRGFSRSGGTERKSCSGSGRAINLALIKKMTPDWEWTPGLYRNKQRELLSNMPHCCEDRGWGAAMSEFNSNLKRYRLPRGHRCTGCDLPAGTIEEGLHMTGYRLRDLAPNISPHNLRKLLKESTGWLKLAEIHKEWRLLTYWETYSGYVAPVNINTLRDDVDDWLTITKHNGERIGESKYVDDIIDETRKFMAEEWSLPENLPTMREWVESGVWMRGKAGTGRNTMIKIEGKEKRTRRYKGVDAALKSNQEIINELLEPRKEEMRIMQKSEGGKVRPVVVGGNELYRKMDFLWTGGGRALRIQVQHTLRWRGWQRDHRPGVARRNSK